LRQPCDLPRKALVELVESVQSLLFLDEAGSNGPFPQHTEFWNPDKQWDVELLELMAQRLGEHGLCPTRMAAIASPAHDFQAAPEFDRPDDAESPHPLAGKTKSRFTYKVFPAARVIEIFAMANSPQPDRYLSLDAHTQAILDALQAGYRWIRTDADQAIFELGETQSTCA
jgi:hypothetical protein